MGIGFALMKGVLNLAFVDHEETEQSLRDQGKTALSICSGFGQCCCANGYSWWFGSLLQM